MKNMKAFLPILDHWGLHEININLYSYRLIHARSFFASRFRQDLHENHKCSSADFGSMGTS